MTSWSENTLMTFYITLLLQINKSSCECSHRPQQCDGVTRSEQVWEVTRDWRGWSTPHHTTAAHQQQQQQQQSLLSNSHWPQPDWGHGTAVCPRICPRLLCSVLPPAQAPYYRVECNVKTVHRRMQSRPHQFCLLSGGKIMLVTLSL